MISRKMLSRHPLPNLGVLVALAFFLFLWFAAGAVALFLLPIVGILAAMSAVDSWFRDLTGEGD